MELHLVEWQAKLSLLYHVKHLDLSLKTIMREIPLTIEPELEKEKHKVDDAVTVDRKHNNNDIQRSKEEDKQQP